jgi:c-di-AMP phosphodiesterase-like protein
VFIVPHFYPNPDFDALGAVIGISLICKKLKKKAYIIIDNDINNFGAEERKVAEYIYDNFNIVNSKTAFDLITNKSAMVAVDVSRHNLLSDGVNLLIPRFNDMFILDHHKEDDKVIDCKYKFIDSSLSSTCEEVARLLLAYGVKFDANIANCLVAGIALDTNKLTKNAGENTFAIITKLIARGADVTSVNNMFSEDYETDKRMLHIVNDVVFPTHIYAIAGGSGDKIIYKPEDIAKASDYLLKYKILASFALGYIDDDTISISARSKGCIDVSFIMRHFGGGGNEYSAAAKVNGMSMEEIKGKLDYIINPCTYLSSEEICTNNCMKLRLTK